jgi:hypothetical protein
MSDYSSINTLIGTFSSIDSITSRAIDSTNLLCIDTSYNRIGINSIDPSFSIHIVDNSDNTNISSDTIGICTPRLYFDISKIKQIANPNLRIGEVFYDNSGFLKIKMS